MNGGTTVARARDVGGLDPTGYVVVPTGDPLHVLTAPVVGRRVCVRLPQCGRRRRADHVSHAGELAVLTVRTARQSDLNMIPWSQDQ